MERVDLAPGQVLRVLTYHRVVDPAKTPNHYGRVSVHPQAFVQHMDFLRSHYQVIGMDQLLSASRGGFAAGSLPRRPVLLTFDDAYTDFVDHALPVLQRYRLPATLFVPTAFPDQPRAFWWDRLHAALECASDLEMVQTPAGLLPVKTARQRRESFGVLRDAVKSMSHHEAMQWVDTFCADLETPDLGGSVLSWEALRALPNAGITLGAHTRTHPMMDQISDEQAREEAAGSLQDLRDHVGDVLPVFAYPSGGYTRSVIQILKEEGFELAFTTHRGLNDLHKADPLQLKRVNVGPATSLPLLRAQLLGWMKYMAR